MSYSPPTPPADLPTDLVETLRNSSPERLRAVAQYADALAEHREREARLEDADEVEAAHEDEDRPDEPPEDLPSDVPPKATITVKEINDNRYYYWQWREGDRIKSKYKGPVDPDE